MTVRDTGTPRLDPSPGNWKLYQRGRMYALAIIDRRGAAFDVVRAEPDLFPVTDLSIREFRFKMNPRSLSLEESAAVTVVPTQDGGQFVEHQGQIYKNITISGTTGLRPNKSRGGFKAVRNPFTNADTDPETGLPVNEKTGFDDLIELRNFFVLYYAKKRDPAVAHDIIMVWQNGRDDEFYIVEPITFRVNRDAGSPFTSNYEINLRTIERLDLSLQLVDEDSLTTKNSRRTVLQRVRAASRTLGSALSLAQNVLDVTVNIGSAVITDIISPANAVFTGLTAIINTTARAFSVPRNTIGVAIQNAYQVADELDKLADAYNAFGIVDNYKGTVKTYRNMARALTQVYVLDELFTTELSSAVSAKARRYRDPIRGMPLTGGDPSNLVNEVSGTSAQEVTVNIGDDIRRIAKRHLGNASRWKIIALLNNLKPPYVSADGDGINVLRPGDRVLIPSTAADAETPISFEGQNELKSSSSLDQRLGRDIKIVNDQAVDGVDTFDFVKDSRGDIARIEGVSNMIQAISIKFETEQGELPAHPRFGIRFPIGIKAPSINSLVAFKVNARSSLLADRRVSDIAAFQLEIDGNILEVRTSVQIKGSDSPLSLGFEVRR